MKMQSLRLRAFIVMACFSLLSLEGWADADPPARVARLGYASGAVSFSSDTDNDWVPATLNRPLTNGDRLWTNPQARAEIQVGGALIRMNGETNFTMVNYDDQIAQLQLNQGTLNVRVRRLEPGQVFEVDTPNFAFTLREPGEYRLEVNPESNATDIVVRKGQGEAYADGTTYVIDPRQPYRFKGNQLKSYDFIDVPRLDEFDRWTRDRDRQIDTSVSARYVSPDVVGYQDLDAYGNWREEPSYGHVWIPNRVPMGWAPYRDGHWAWINPWGWTWVDDAPWGFAVSHYGRWTFLAGTWGWVPGPIRARAYYAPALVVFIGGDNFTLSLSSSNVSGIAWFPLGPREVYRPPYQASPRYIDNINRSNTVIHNTVINTTQVNKIVYVNRQVPGAVIAVPTSAFVQSHPVPKAAVRVPRDILTHAPATGMVPPAPRERGQREPSGQGERKPGRQVERPNDTKIVVPPTPQTVRTAPVAATPATNEQPPKATPVERTRETRVNPERRLKPIQSPRPTQELAPAPVPTPATQVTPVVRVVPVAPVTQPNTQPTGRPLHRPITPTEQPKPSVPATQQEKPIIVKPAEVRAPVAMPKHQPQTQSPVQAEPKAEPHVQKPQRGEKSPSEVKKDVEELKREEEKHKPKG